jgi:C4-dicarboxylate-specific signal transduction histidine kinase
MQRLASRVEQPFSVSIEAAGLAVFAHRTRFRYDISVRTELAADLPQTMGDRVQLQQVMMNLIINSIDAMKEVDGTREMTVKSQIVENDQLHEPSNCQLCPARLTVEKRT